MARDENGNDSGHPDKGNQPAGAAPGLSSDISSIASRPSSSPAVTLHTPRTADHQSLINIATSLSPTALQFQPDRTNQIQYISTSSLKHEAKLTSDPNSKLHGNCNRDIFDDRCISVSEAAIRSLLPKLIPSLSPTAQSPTGTNEKVKTKLNAPSPRGSPSASDALHGRCSEAKPATYLMMRTPN
ncbi:hypothetical protein M422DRAFT_248351 [Sphaerobolus stellatus SS14]|uniref:Uncharacterized protein n=1 Tax=Sphaerobolus stellatus (strain SS14) TaxID=990650 RepID=A0A0C9VVR4_SPHS4|nr:hypothetical protein M422DRAFT_248351 [Sphaerobolus stellatus SS14]